MCVYRFGSQVSEFGVQYTSDNRSLHNIRKFVCLFVVHFSTYLTKFGTENWDEILLV